MTITKERTDTLSPMKILRPSMDMRCCTSPVLEMSSNLTLVGPVSRALMDMNERSREFDLLKSCVGKFSVRDGVGEQIIRCARFDDKTGWPVSQLNIVLSSSEWIVVHNL